MKILKKEKKFHLKIEKKIKKKEEKEETERRIFFQKKNRVE
jgi:hypothetical protein